MCGIISSTASPGKRSEIEAAGMGAACDTNAFQIIRHMSHQHIIISVN